MQPVAKQHDSAVDGATIYLITNALVWAWLKGFRVEDFGLRLEACSDNRVLCTALVLEHLRPI